LAEEERSAVLIRHLRAGKSPKEIAWKMNRTPWAIWKAIQRSADAHEAYLETYHRRHPNKESPPIKIIKVFVQ
jgi:transposase